MMTKSALQHNYKMKLEMSQDRRLIEEGGGYLVWVGAFCPCVTCFNMLPLGLVLCLSQNKQGLGRNRQSPRNQRKHNLSSLQAVNLRVSCHSVTVQNWVTHALASLWK